MITCYFGKLGQGKTYALAEHALRELKKGRVVYANFHIEWNGLPPVRIGKKIIRPAVPKENYKTFESVEQFLEMEDGLVALDEGWIYFDSYKMTSFPIEFRMKILQSRKDGLDIAYTSQRPEQVHVSLRAMTNEYYECEAGRIPFTRYPVFYRYNADLVNGTIKRDGAIGWEEKKTADGGSQWVEIPKEQRPKIIWPSQEVFMSFDTKEKIALPTKYKKLRHAPKRIQDISPPTKEMDSLKNN
jgi:hypothetical protein